MSAKPDPDAFWQNFIKSVQAKYHTIWPSVDLFHEAIRCYKIEAYLAACTMCRASVEAILHLAKTRKGAIVEIDPNTYFKDLIRWAKNDNLLTGIEKKVEDIRDWGDFGAHLAQKIDKAYSKLKPDLAEAITIWADPPTSWQCIEDTAIVIRQVTNLVWT